MNNINELQIKLLEAYIRSQQLQTELQRTVEELARTVDKFAAIEQTRTERLTVAIERMAGCVAVLAETARAGSSEHGRQAALLDDYLKRENLNKEGM